MSSNVGYASLTIVPSAKGFGSALGGEVNGPLKAAGGKGGGIMGGALIGGLAKVAAPLAAVAGAAAMGGFVKSAVAAAADLEQSVGAIDAVFKGSAGQMHEWASTSSKTVGLSANDYNTLGTLIGAQLKNGGVAMDQLAGKSNELIGTAADLSAQFGGSTAEAVEALSSALKGERDPIEKYGVSLNQARVDAKAAELGFKKVGGTLSTEANQAATLAIIMEQTADAHGAFARETDTLAHKQQVLSAMWQDGKAKLGNAFLPAVSAAAGGLIGILGPAINGSVKGITTLSSTVGGGARALVAAFQAGGNDITSTGFAGVMERIGLTARGVFDSITAAVGPFVPAIVSAFSALGPQIAGILPLFNPLGLVFKALLPILPQLAGMIASLAAQIGPLLGSTLALVVPLVGQLVDALSGVFLAAMPAVVQMVGALGGALSLIIPAVAGVLASLAPLVSTLIAQLVPIIMQLVTSVLPPVAQIFGLIVMAIAPLITQLAAVLIPIIQALMPVVVTVFGVVANVISAAMQIVQGIIDVVLGVISGNWGQVWDGIVGIFSGVWNLIVSLVKGAIALVGSIIGAGVNIVGTLWRTAWNGVVTVFRTIWNLVSNAVSGGIDKVVGFVRGLQGRIMGFFHGAGSWLVDIGQNIIKGLINGIKGAVGWLHDTIKKAIGGVVDFAKGLLGIHSPSRVFRQIGDYTAQGMALGLMDGAKDVRKAADGLIPSAPHIPAPTVGAGVSGALAAVANAQPGDRPIYTDDGALFGVIRQLANGEARLVLAEVDRQTANGFRRL